MPTITLHGPVVPSGVHNVVLRDAHFNSTVARLTDPANYAKIEVGVREGAYTTWIGTWDQTKQKVDASVPFSILDASRVGMRLRENQAIVVKVTVLGRTTSLVGSRITFRLALVGGRDGPAKPLVSAGAASADPNSRTALAALERQINLGGLSEWEDSVDIVDPLGVQNVGYVAGMGGAVIQATSKSTGVTLHRLCGQITTHGATLNAGAEVTFTVTNNRVASTDVVAVCVQSGGTSGAYLVVVGAVASGSFDVTLGNVSAGNLTETLILNFIVLKSVAS